MFPAEAARPTRTPTARPVGRRAGRHAHGPVDDGPPRLPARTVGANLCEALPMKPTVPHPHQNPAGPGVGGDQPRTRGDASRPEGPSLPHDRDQQAAATDPDPNPHIDRAARDLAQGQVDTDLRATPGLDAERRGDLVQGGERSAGDHKRRR